MTGDASATQKFKIAPMDTLMWLLTSVVLALPVLFFSCSVNRGPIGLGFAVIAGFLVAIYALVWFWYRPNRFEVTADALVIRWPLRSRSIPLDDVVSVMVLDRSGYREQLGWAVRIGAGGLWGGFGWLWTSHRGLIDMYISRLSGLVLLERHDGRDLLISPADPERMRALLES